MIVYKFILRNLCLRQRFLLLFNFIPYLFIFLRKNLLFGEVNSKLVREEYPYVDSLILTFFVLGVFDSELPFADSLRRERNQSGARRNDVVAITKVPVETEHARVSTTVEVTAAEKPGITGIREERVIRVPST